MSAEQQRRVAVYSVSIIIFRRKGGSRITYLGLTAIEFFIVTVAIFAILYWLLPRKASWIALTVAAFLLALLAFKFEPNETDDLSRYFHTLGQLKEGGRELFDRRVEEGYMSWDVYSSCAYYFYYVSKLSDVHYLPAITIFLVYGLAFLVFYKAAMHFDVSKSYLFIGVMFFISTYWYYDVASGIRNGLSFAITLACAYYHLVEKKNIILCIAGYVIAALMHSSGIVLVALVALTILTQKFKGKVLNFLLIFSITGGATVIDFLADLTGNKFLNSIAEKAEGSSNGLTLNITTNYAVNIAVMVVVAFLLFYFSLYMTESDYSNDLKLFVKFSTIICFFSVGCFANGLLFVRIVRFAMPFLGALIFMIGMQLQKNEIDRRGEAYLVHYTASKYSVRAKARSYVNFVSVIFIAIHMWYLINGSSLTWIHF